jgi:hypothetical protein
MRRDFLQGQVGIFIAVGQFSQAAVILNHNRLRAIQPDKIAADKFR